MKIGHVLALVLVLAVAVSLFAADAPTSASKPSTLRGKIVKVDGVNVTVKTMVRGGEGKEVVVVTDDKTTVTLDGKAAKVADLKADLFVKVTPAEGTAVTIDATTKAPERPAKKPAA